MQLSEPLALTLLCFAATLPVPACCCKLLLHAHPPDRCAALPCTHEHTHHPYPPSTSDLKASDDGAPLLLLLSCLLRS